MGTLDLKEDSNVSVEVQPQNGCGFSFTIRVLTLHLLDLMRRFPWFLTPIFGISLGFSRALVCITFYDIYFLEAVEHLDYHRVFKIQTDHRNSITQRSCSEVGSR